LSESSAEVCKRYGLRISELIGLSWADVIEREKGVQLSVTGKGGRTRQVLLPQIVSASPLALRGDAGANDPVFASHKGGRRLTERTVGYMLKLPRAFDPLSTLNLQKSTFRGSFAVRRCRVTDKGGVSRTPLRHQGLRCWWLQRFRSEVECWTTSSDHSRRALALLGISQRSAKRPGLTVERPLLYLNCALEHSARTKPRMT
jgi:integrase